MNANHETMNARSETIATLVKAGLVNEQGEMRGVYTASCIGPKDEALYAYTRDLFIREIGDVRKAIDFLRRDGPGFGRIPEAIYDLTPSARIMLRILQSIEFVTKWEDSYKNVITTVGANEMLDKYFAGSSYTAAMVMGLKGTGTAVIADTQASHASWSEVGLANAPVYTGNRPTPTWSAASAKSKAISAAINFAFTSGGTVAGSFLNQGGSATKDNTTGVLVSAGDFTGGNKVVANTDQINVSWSVSV